MQVQVDSSQIAQLEQNIQILMGMLRAVVLKHADAKGIYRLTTPEQNKAEAYDMNWTRLKKSVKFEVKERDQ